MKVTLNGDSHSLADDATVVDAVRLLDPQCSPKGVAVALNGEVVSRSQWSDRRLHEDDRIEVLRAVGGG